MLKRVMMIPPLPRPPPPLIYPSSFSSSSITFLLSFIFLLWIVVSSFPLSLRFFYASISIFKADFLSLVSFFLFSALFPAPLCTYMLYLSSVFSRTFKYLSSSSVVSFSCLSSCGYRLFILFLYLSLTFTSFSLPAIFSLDLFRLPEDIENGITRFIFVPLLRENVFEILLSFRDKRRKQKVLGKSDLY